MAFATWAAARRTLSGTFAALLVLVVSMTSLPAHADLGAAARSVPAAELVGQGRLTFLGFRVFDAELFAPNGRYDPSEPFALKLTYLRNFTGAAIASETVKQMRRQGYSNTAKLADWEQRLSAMFPNVRRGESITGVRTSSGVTDLYYGNRKIGTIRDSEFTRRFFSIWLGSNTKNPSLRARLVGART
ncbi:MAG: chalcone isomerase family protein [Roseibium sp.]|nr:chalcone isomerase family protein [Roseibium sp.]